MSTGSTPLPTLKKGWKSHAMPVIAIVPVAYTALKREVSGTILIKSFQLCLCLVHFVISLLKFISINFAYNS
jgi:hypothetical protein